MCDEKTLEDWEKYLKNKPVTRRKFNTLTAGAGLAAALPSVANAQRVTAGPVAIRTPDGTADCFMAHSPNGSNPGILLWPDVLGLRPVYMDMARQLAANGFSVLAVNPYYRDAQAPVVSSGASFSDPAVRELVLPMAQNLDADTHFTDARAFVDFLEGHGAVSNTRKMGTIGYCMGGPMVMRTAAVRPDHIGAAASFHGARLVTEDDDSPHLLIPDMKAEFLIAIAENDDDNEPQAKSILRESFSEAGLQAEVEVYEGAQHGWTVSDSAAYNDEHAVQAWTRMLALFERALSE